MLNKNIFKSKFFKRGLPFILLVVGGSIGLRNFTTLRYDECIARNIIAWIYPDILPITKDYLHNRKYITTQIRKYDFSKSQKVPVAERVEIEKLFKKSVDSTIDEEYEKYKQIDIENWENKRIPRPWEEEEGQASK